MGIDIGSGDGDAAQHHSKSSTTATAGDVSFEFTHAPPNSSSTLRFSQARACKNPSEGSTSTLKASRKPTWLGIAWAISVGRWSDADILQK